MSKKLLRNIGPGFLLAGAAIGVSHLVQATRAGADYGWILIIALILACISKYPFLQFGPRYAAATNQNLVQGYRDLGKIPFIIYIFITLGTMFIIQAAVTLVTAGLFAYFFEIDWSILWWCCLIFMLCVSLLTIGRYPGLDKTMKVVISLLTICTFIAVLMASVSTSYELIANAQAPSLKTSASLAFIIAFMGWMPIPIDAGVWHSIWTLENSKHNKQQTSKSEAIWDFNIGYYSASIIGLLFFLLGVLVMFGTGNHFSDNSVIFSGQLVDLYGKTLGDWAKPIIAFAAIITMLSTTLTVCDAYPRVLSEIFSQTALGSKIAKSKSYFIGLYFIPVISLLVIYFGTTTFTVLIDFAAGLSFISAPILGWFNLKLMKSDKIEAKDKPSKGFFVFSWICLSFLFLFSLAYLWTLFL
ncbi:MAG: NRAMP family divalent metal transporter [Bacteroidota bacterium]